MRACKRIEDCEKYDECPNDFCYSESLARSQCAERGFFAYLRRDFKTFLEKIAKEQAESDQKPRTIEDI